MIHNQRGYGADTVLVDQFLSKVREGRCQPFLVFVVVQPWHRTVFTFPPKETEICVKQLGKALRE